MSKRKSNRRITSISTINILAELAFEKLALLAAPTITAVSAVKKRCSMVSIHSRQECSQRIRKTKHYFCVRLLLAMVHHCCFRNNLFSLHDYGCVILLPTNSRRHFLHTIWDPLVSGNVSAIKSLRDLDEVETDTGKIVVKLCLCCKHMYYHFERLWIVYWNWSVDNNVILQFSTHYCMFARIIIIRSDIY